MTVYLPPGYARHTARRYPSVYLLHGGRESDRAWNGGGSYRDWPDSSKPLSVRRLMDSLIATGSIRPMIVVMPDVRDKFDGSWYANSPMTGQWEDYATRELVAYVDRRFRTVPRASARGVAGHSLGGYGALRLAMRHPDVFSTVFALSPCCLSFDGEMGLHSSQWRQTLALADSSRNPMAFKQYRGPLPWAFYTAALAFTPDPANPPLYVRWPVALKGDSIVLVPELAAAWRANAVLSAVRRDAMAVRQLRGIAFVEGTREPFAEFARDARTLSDTLTALGIPHTYGVFDGGHEDRIAEQLRSRVFPFFSQRLSRASASDKRALRADGAQWKSKNLRARE